MLITFQNKKNKHTFNPAHEDLKRVKPTRLTVSKTCTSPIVALPGYAR